MLDKCFLNSRTQQHCDTFAGNFWTYLFSLITTSFFQIVKSENKFDLSLEDLVPIRRKKRVPKSVSVVKGRLGFGFSFITSPMGSIISIIWDMDRCKGLRPFDLITHIDQKDIRGENRERVVMILREITEKVVVDLTIDRGMCMRELLMFN